MKYLSFIPKTEVKISKIGFYAGLLVGTLFLFFIAIRYAYEWIWIIFPPVLVMVFLLASDDIVIGLLFVAIYETITDNFLDTDPSMYIGPLNVYLSDVVWIFFLGVFLYRVFKTKFVNIANTSSGRWFILFFSWVIIGAISGSSIYAQSALGDARRFLSMLCIAIYCASFTLDDRTIKNISKVLVFFVIFHVLLAVLRWAGIVQMPWYVDEFGGEDLWAYRAVDEMKTFYMLSMVAVVFILMKTGLIKRRLYLYLFMLSLLIMVVIMQHRSVWVSAIVMILFFLLFFFSVRGQIYGLIAVSVVVFVLIKFKLTFTASGGLGNTIYTSMISSWEDPNSTAMWRIANWLGLLENMTLRDYIIGTKFGTYFPGRYIMAEEINVYTSPHNFFVRIMYKLGSIGLFIFIVLQAILMKKLWRIGKQVKSDLHKSMGLIMFSILIGLNAMFLSYEPAIDYGIFLGLSIAFVQRKEFRLVYA